MSVLDTYRVFEALTDAGFTESQAKALVDAGREGYGALVTKADIQDMVTKADIQDMATKADLQNMVTKADLQDMATKADFQDMVTKADLRDLEQRLTLKVGAMLFAFASLLVGVRVVLEPLPL